MSELIVVDAHNIINMVNKSSQTIQKIKLAIIFIYQSKVLFLIINGCVMGSILSFHRRRSDCTITPFGPNHVFLVGKLSPVSNPLLSASLPLLLSENSELLNDLFGFHLFHLLVVGRLLQFYYMVFFILQVLKNLEASLLILFLESSIGKQQLSIFGSSFVLFLPLKLCSFSGLTHDAKIDLSLFWIAQGFMGLLDSVPGILGPRVFAFIWMEYHCEGFILLFDLILGSKGIELQHIIRIVKFLIGQSLYFDVCLEHFCLY